MEYLILASIIGMIVIRFTKEKEIMRISWDKLAQFVAFLVMLFVIRLLSFDFMMDMGLMKELPQLPEQIAYSKWSLGLVFWEDMFFGVPLYFIWKYMNRKWLQVTITVVVSVLFGMGHAYQGPFAIALTTLAPYYISYNFGKKYGFGTCMCGHILYDVSTVYLVKLLPYLI